MDHKICQGDYKLVTKIALIGSGSTLARNFIDICQGNPSLDILGFQRTKKKNKGNVSYYQIIRGVPVEPEILSEVDAAIYFIGTNIGPEKELEDINIETLKKYLEVHPKERPLIYISSVAVLTQESVYAHAKKVCEKLIKENISSFTIIRPSLLYGKYDKANLSSLKKKIKWLPLIPSPPEEHEIQPVHMVDLSEFILKLIQEKKIANQELVCSNPVPVSSYQVIKRMASDFSGPKIVIPIPLKVVHILAKLISLVLPRFDLKSQLENMSSHEPFDSTEAMKLGYTPRKYKGI